MPHHATLVSQSSDANHTLESEKKINSSVLFAPILQEHFAIALAAKVLT
jgi:hypothetical protein